MTFFVLDGKSTEEVMEERGWIPSTFADAPAWEDAVQRRIKSEAVELRTSDDRSLKALWTSRHCPSSGPSAGIPHPEYAGRAVAVLFHANAQIGESVISLVFDGFPACFLLPITAPKYSFFTTEGF
jgi:hypothetical protein